nr:DUF5819 family protein [Luteimicrobium album]
MSSAVNAPLRSYMLPLFQQNWSLFAPNPVADQYLLEVRGVSKDLTTTPWLTPSADELEGLRHSVLPDRTVRLTSELSRSAARAINGLPDEAEKYVGWNYHYDAWNRLRDDMASTNHGSVSTAIDTALGYDEVLTLYATQFLAATPHDGIDVTYVQYRIVRDQTESYYSTARGTTSRTTVVTSGRRPLETRPGQDRKGFSAFVDSQGSR